jgi:hypothetical protein
VEFSRLVLSICIVVCFVIGRYDSRGDEEHDRLVIGFICDIIVLDSNRGVNGGRMIICFREGEIDDDDDGGGTGGGGE